MSLNSRCFHRDDQLGRLDRKQVARRALQLWSNAIAIASAERGASNGITPNGDIEALEAAEKDDLILRIAARRAACGRP
jgi:hypothetical protein